MRKLRTIEMNRLTLEEFKEAEKLPLIVVLDDVRSLYNVGSVFRSCDAFRVEAVYLCGITATPPNAEIHKTALGGEDSVDWEYFKTTEEALEIANDTLYGLGAGVWTRDAHELYTVPRAIQAGRVWVNQYHAYPAGAPFGGYKQSGIGRENHKMMLGHYRQAKNMLISYNKNKLGFF